jgi:predicted nucleic acid-binding protein
MPGTDGSPAFIDTNVLVYLLSADEGKAARAEEVLRAGGAVSVQVLNELANVARRKRAMTWDEVGEVVGLIRAVCPVVPLTVEVHDHGRRIAERHGLGVYDAMIVAAALLHGCGVLYSEDMQDGLVVDGRLRIRNPFTPEGPPA